MRTRSGSLAAVLARVPSHPAHPGMACICAERANDTQIQRSVGGSLNTADGFHALFNVTGAANAAFGWNSLLFDTTGNFNTGAGAGTLALNNADANTAVGTAALILNVDGGRNTAVGAAAMVNNAGDACRRGIIQRCCRRLCAQR